MTQTTMSSGLITIMHVPGAASSVSDVAALREQRTPPPPEPDPGTPSGSPPNDADEHNPFAPPPKGAPEQPRLPADQLPADQLERQQPQPPGGGTGGGTGPPGGGTGGGTGPRFDVADPVQRRARYALLAGMWGLFFGLFNLPEVALLLGTLALYWGISSMRAKPKDESEAGTGTGTGTGTGAGTRAGRAEVLAAMQPGPPRDAVPIARPASPYGQDQRNPQSTAAVSGIIAGLVALAIVAMTFTIQIAYKDYYACVNDALTQPARQSCNTLLPKPLQSVLGSQS
jgi:hypothetical protein